MTPLTEHDLRRALKESVPEDGPPAGPAGTDRTGGHHRTGGAGAR